MLTRLETEMRKAGCSEAEGLASCEKGYSFKFCTGPSSCTDQTTLAQLWDMIKASVKDCDSKSCDFKNPKNLAKIDCGYHGKCDGGVTPPKLLKNIFPHKAMLKELGFKDQDLEPGFFRRVFG